MACYPANTNTTAIASTSASTGQLTTDDVTVTSHVDDITTMANYAVETGRYCDQLKVIS